MMGRKKSASQIPVDNRINQTTEDEFVEEMKLVLLEQQAVDVIRLLSLNLDMNNDEEDEARARAQVLAGLIDPSYRVPKRRRDDKALDILEAFTGKKVEPLSPIHGIDGDYERDYHWNLTMEKERW